MCTVWTDETQINFPSLFEVIWNYSRCQWQEKRRKWGRTPLRRIAQLSGSALLGVLRMDDDGDTTELPFDSRLQIYIIFWGVSAQNKKTLTRSSQLKPFLSKIKVIKLVIRHPGSLCVCVYISVSLGMSICGWLCVCVCVCLCVWQIFHWCVIISKGLVVLGPAKQSDTLQFPKETQIPITRMSFCYTSSKQEKTKNKRIASMSTERKILLCKSRLMHCTVPDRVRVHTSVLDEEA